jgi:hypothetical protein
MDGIPEKEEEIRPKGKQDEKGKRKRGVKSPRLKGYATIRM